MPAERQELTVVADANAIVQGPWKLDSAAWRVMLYQVESGAIRLIVPEVVVREVVGRFKSELQKRFNELDQSVRNLSRVCMLDKSFSERPDIEEQVRGYESDLRSTLLDAGASIEPLPDVDVSGLVDRAIERKRPFDESGSGFRDSLLWETVVTESNIDSDRKIVLISNDSRAFQSSSNSVDIHHDLIADLANRGGGNPIALCSSPNSYLDHVGHGDPQLEIQIVECISADSARLESLIQDLLIESELDSRPLNMPASVIEVSNTHIRFDRSVASSPEDRIVLVHLEVECALKVRLLFTNHATPQETEVAAYVRMNVTASYDTESRILDDLEAELPPLTAIPEVVTAINEQLLEQFANPYITLNQKLAEQFANPLTTYNQNLAEQITNPVTTYVQNLLEQFTKPFGDLIDQQVVQEGTNDAPDDDEVDS